MAERGKLSRGGAALESIGEPAKDKSAYVVATGFSQGAMPLSQKRAKLAEIASVGF
ncbi:MAG TPA: hypothetical protein VKB56_00820 [Terriglobales bacterium]|nr:hypothetical protein [Terriglobales bacterium]